MQSTGSFMMTKVRPVWLSHTYMYTHTYIYIHIDMRIELLKMHRLLTVNLIS